MGELLIGNTQLQINVSALMTKNKPPHHDILAVLMAEKADLFTTIHSHLNNAG
jgi:hypothetical protein